MRNKKYDDDDDRVIADMSQVTRHTFRNKLESKIPSKNQEGEKLTGKNLFAAIMGTLSASLLIGLIYIVVFGIVIFILYSLFKSKLGL